MILDSQRELQYNKINKHNIYTIHVNKRICNYIHVHEYVATQRTHSIINRCGRALCRIYVVNIKQVISLVY